MNPYEILNVPKRASLAVIKKAYRTLSAKYHPDKQLGGEKVFLTIKEAYDILSDAGRRERFDSTGRTTVTLVTPAAMERFLDETFQVVVDTDDDAMNNDVLGKVIASLANARVGVNQNLNTARRKLRKAQTLLARFTRKDSHADENDLVKKILMKKIEVVMAQVHLQEDALELSQKAEALLRTYKYRVGPDAEGQVTPRPTTRLLGGSGVRVSQDSR